MPDAVELECPHCDYAWHSRCEKQALRELNAMSTARIFADSEKKQKRLKQITEMLHGTSFTYVNGRLTKWQIIQ